MNLRPGDRYFRCDEPIRSGVVLGCPVAGGVCLGGSWVISGGFFAPGHAADEVPIPGELTVTLPAGPARLYVQEHGYFGKGRSATIPRGMTTVGHESWNTFATFDVPATGSYRITVLDPGDNGDSRHSITIGKGQWAPLPPWLFGLGVLAVAVVIGFIADQIRKRINDRTAG